MRDAFLLDPSVTFLNHGSFGACPRPVLDALWGWQREVEKNPVEFLARRSAGLLRDARASLGAFVGAPSDELAFVSNTTTAVNAVARSLALSPGDEVLATDHEYGACDAAWRRACAECGAHYRKVAIPLPFDRTTFVERVLSAVTPRTKLVFLSHITSTTALTFPVAELCGRARERGILSFVDGAHAPGHVPLDIRSVGADFYAGNAHKWMCAPKGSAFLHARSQHHENLTSPIVSWGDVAQATFQHAGMDAYTGTTLLERRFQWQGTRDLAPFLTVPAAIRFLEQHQWQSLGGRCHALAREAATELSRRFGIEPIAAQDDFAQMVAIPVPHSDAEGLRRRLFEESAIEIPVTSHAEQSFVRLSVYGYNDARDIARLLEAPALLV